MIAIDLSKQKALDANAKTMQQINFTANLDQDERTEMYFITEKAKKPF